jgi:hypothetical protein
LFHIFTFPPRASNRTGKTPPSSNRPRLGIAKRRSHAQNLQLRILHRQRKRIVNVIADVGIDDDFLLDSALFLLTAILR